MTELPAGPALQESQSNLESPTAGPSTGTKRKTRSGSAKPSPVPRVTRRTAANVVSSLSAPAGGASEASGSGGNVHEEPARGEEVNLNGYWAPESSTSKRARRTPPDPSPSQRFYPAGGDAVGEGWGNTRAGSAAGIDQLASAAVADEARRSPPRPYPYPFGVTPFRYPCLAHDRPPPPPGDPNDHNFKPFNPHTIHSPASSDSSAGSPPSIPSGIPSIPSSNAPHLSHPSHPQSGQPSYPNPHQYASQAEVEANANAAYESISALLSASQAPDV
ncbi:hypothetical protein IAT38_001012 [Cryptococcus sp. DSM 104549]